MHGDGGAAMSAVADVRPALMGHLKDLRLPAVRECYEDTARRAERETLSYEQYLLEVISRECEQRRKSRVQRLLKDSALPLEKSLQTFDLKAVAGESDTAVPDAAGRQLSGPERERFGFRESGVGEEPSSDGAGPGTGGGARTQDALHQVRTANAGLIGGQAGPAAEPRDQTAGPLRRFDH